MENQFVKSCIEYGLKNGGRSHADAFQIGRNKIAEDMGEDLGITRKLIDQSMLDQGIQHIRFNW